LEKVDLPTMAAGLLS